MSSDDHAMPFAEACAQLVVLHTKMETVEEELEELKRERVTLLDQLDAARWEAKCEEIRKMRGC